MGEIIHLLYNNQRADDQCLCNDKRKTTSPRRNEIPFEPVTVILFFKALIGLNRDNTK